MLGPNSVHLPSALDPVVDVPCVSTPSISGATNFLYFILARKAKRDNPSVASGGDTPVQAEGLGLLPPDAAKTVGVLLKTVGGVVGGLPAPVGPLVGGLVNTVGDTVVGLLGRDATHAEAEPGVDEKADAHATPMVRSLGMTR